MSIKFAESKKNRHRLDRKYSVRLEKRCILHEKGQEIRHSLCVYFSCSPTKKAFTRGLPLQRNVALVAVSLSLLLLLSIQTKAKDFFLLFSL